MKAPMRAGAVLGAVVLVAAVVLGGSQLPVAQPRASAPVDPSGRTVQVCPPGGEVHAVSASSWGSLGVRQLSGGDLQQVPAGKALSVPNPNEPVLVVAEGRQSQTSAAAVWARHDTGQDRGTALARCTAPATTSWFSGVYAQNGSGPATMRSQVLLTNPDSSQAEVDLQFYGENGLVSAPGGRAIVVPAHGVRTIAVDTLFTADKPVGMEVRASRGRIAASVRDVLTSGVQAAGMDWQSPGVDPGLVQVIPAVADGPGARDLVVTNPGQRRTTARIEVIGPQGTYVPVDAGTLELGPQSTGTISVQRGLNGDAAAIRVSADQPVVAAVALHSSEKAGESDLSVVSAASELSGTSIGAIAVNRQMTGAVMISNTGAKDVTVPLRLVDGTGREVNAVELPVRAGSTALWEVKQVDQPAAVLVKAPTDSQLFGGVVITAGSGAVASMASAALAVPERVSDRLDPRLDAGVGR